MIKTEFGNTIRKVRRENQLTQERVALSCNMSLRFYQDLEAGNKQPTITTLFRLARALDVSPNQLIEPAWLLWKNTEA